MKPDMPVKYEIDCPLCMVAMKQVQNIIHKSNKIFVCELCDGIFSSNRAETETRELYRQAMLKKHVAR